MLEIVALVLLSGAAAVWFSLQKGDRRIQVWLDAAASCGLQMMEITGRSRFKARVGRLEVHIESSGPKASRARIGIVVPGPPDFYNVRIRPESSISVPWVREVEIGDESFDNKFFVEGPIWLVCALLDAETRRLLVRASAESPLEIHSGGLRTEVSDEEISHLLPLLLDLGQRLADSMDVGVPRRLAGNAKRDPEAGVRLQSLLLLIRQFPGDPETVEALRDACSDSNLRIRLRAAVALGTEGWNVLVQLAKSTEDDDCSAQAMRIVGPELPFDRTRAILAQALRSRRRRTAHACVEALGRSGTAEAVAALAKITTRNKSHLATAAARALGVSGSAAAEQPLTKALLRDRPDLRVAAANALGKVGSAAAVLSLKEAAERFRQDRDLRQAARQAIAEIQSRLAGAMPGQLSLTQDGAGQLSLAADQAGQLSLPPAEVGQISLSDEPGSKPPR